MLLKNEAYNPSMNKNQLLQWNIQIPYSLWSLQLNLESKTIQTIHYLFFQKRKIEFIHSFLRPWDEQETLQNKGEHILERF